MRSSPPLYQRGRRPCLGLWADQKSGPSTSWASRLGWRYLQCITYYLYSQSHSLLAKKKLHHKICLQVTVCSYLIVVCVVGNCGLLETLVCGICPDECINVSMYFPKSLKLPIFSQSHPDQSSLNKMNQSEPK